MADKKQLAEEFEARINYAKMLIRDGQVDDGLRVIEEVEQQYSPYFDNLPPQLRYLIPYSRGRAYLQIKQPSRARIEFETAVRLAGPDIEARARSQNLLGAALYAEEQPSSALKYHLVCVTAIVQGPIKDLVFRLSVYQNLANDYWALNEIELAIGAYKEALLLLEDLDAPDRQADIFWGLSLAYKARKEWRYARLYVKRAIQLFQSTGNRAAEAAMHINFGEILLEEGLTREAAQPLDQALKLLSGTDHFGLLSFVHRYCAEIARITGELGQAAEYAKESIRYAEILLNSDQTIDSHVWIEPNRTHAEALHGAALIMEAKGERDAADTLFEQAFERLRPTTLTEIKSSIHLSYAGVLEARGDYKGAIEQYKAANDSKEDGV
ncbi:MAG TPA: hypothetical protein VGE45_20960 [Chloroflexia bacterium]|jgi:tetratricopeptide (TPR) repeat protein